MKLPPASRRRVLIIGYGNSWMCDDGAGPAVVERLARATELDALQASGRLRLMSCMQLLPELALEWADVDRVVLIDAAIGLAPGALRIHRIEPTQSQPIPGAAGSNAPSLVHRWSPGTLASLALAMQGRCARIAAYTIGGELFEPGAYLSPQVGQTVTKLAEKLVKRWTK